MIIEPTSTNPTSRRGQAARLLGVTLPVALLIAVVGGGVLGRTEDPAPTAQATARPTSQAALEPSSSPVSEGVAVAADSGFPTVAGDLAVRTVTEVLAGRAGGDPDLVVAVAGYLGAIRPLESCDGGFLGALGPLCERSGVLSDQPRATRDNGAPAAPGAHLHPRFDVGVGLPDEVARLTGAGASAPVVLLGRLDGTGTACRPGGFGCGEAFLVDRIIWVDGAWLASSPVIDAGVDGLPREWMLHNQDLAVVATIGWSSTVLVSALLRPETVARVDAVAAEALLAAPTPAGLVWYVRGLDTGYDPVRYPLGRSPPRLAWVVLDDVSGTVLARGPAPAKARP